MTDAAMVADRRRELVRQAFILEYVTFAWMLIEAGVAIGAGLAARSITLLAFGIDSLIELASAMVLIWRLTVELRHGQSSRNLPNVRQVALAEHFCLRSQPMSWWRPDGGFGRGEGNPSRGRG